MKKIILILLLLTTQVNAADVICYDQNNLVTEYRKSAHSPYYPGCLKDPDLTGLPNDIDLWIIENGSVREMTPSEKTTYRMQEAKEARKAEINSKTLSLVQNGFIYDSVEFSLDPIAVSNWIGLYAARASLTYPLVITNKSGEAYTLQDQAALRDFFLSGVNTIKTNYDSARALVKSVKDCTTYQCVKAVEDNR